MKTSTKIAITEEEIKKIVEIAVDNDIEEFTMTGNWYEDYGMDSLGVIALVVEVQKRYSIRLPDERMPDIRTGSALILAIREMQGAAS